jgi:hypothetical protein
VTITLAELVNRLEEDVPARDGLPSAAQYERCVKDAVADYGRRAGRTKAATLTLVAGTATYDLPADFVKLVRLASPAGAGSVLYGAGGKLVPVPAGYRETYTVANGQITISPTPTAAGTREMTYQAGWALDETDSYPEMGESEAETLLMLAASKALTLLANRAAQDAWSYQIGDERVNMERLAEALNRQAQALADQYKAALASQHGPYGTRSRYPEGSY